MSLDAQQLVDMVRAAARAHASAWEALVPDAFTVNAAVEAAEEDAYADLVAAKAALCDHVLATYGVTLAELSGLAMP